MDEASYFAEEKQENVEFFGEANRIKKLLQTSARKIEIAMGIAGQIMSCESTGKTQEEENADRLESRSSTNDANSILSCCAINPRMGIQTLATRIINNEIDPFTDGADKCSKKSICGAKFATLFDGLVNVCNFRLAMTDATEKVHTMRLRRAWTEQDKYKEEIRGLRNELHSLRMCMKMRVAAKQRQTEKKEQEIAETRAECERQIQILSERSEQRMKEAISVSTSNQEELSRELVNVQELLAKIRLDHSSAEKNLREIKKSLEDELLSKISDYDTKMQQLADEIEATGANYTLELRQLERLNAKFEAQEIEYEAAMEEKSAEEQKELDRRIYLFRTRFAAMRIQHCWRAYQIKKIEYMKSKKGKKGRKKAAKKS
ncbi:dynein regulatory complex protein 10-like [Neocloeon triangulifer]|uniref:dynein regulatory complex protein 10-like n=1 Tax=Neocloeon triangulifer TaxID=2078957 RepID=UPI00286F0D0D|nr:dynein regulatory complex protein 10-like [Neocloeon triangulifer]